MCSQWSAPRPRRRRDCKPLVLVNTRAACLELALLDPELRRDFGLVAANLLDESLGILAPDEQLERIPKREVGREGVVDDGVDDHGRA